LIVKIRRKLKQGKAIRIVYYKEGNGRMIKQLGSDDPMKRGSPSFALSSKEEMRL